MFYVLLPCRCKRLQNQQLIHKASADERSRRADTGIPLNYRHMPGFGVHTFKMINEAGKETYVKFHWKPQQGEATLTNEQADQVEAGLGPKKPVTATLDLFNSIEKGEKLHSVNDCSSGCLRLRCVTCSHARFNKLWH